MSDDNPCPESKMSVLLLEPFYGGSHKQLMDLLHAAFKDTSDLITMKAKKWHWRARCSALWFMNAIPSQHHYRVLFCSSTLNLCELISLRSDLAPLKKIIYFHENQLIYPVRRQQDRDFQYGYNQILSCLVADQIVFNSVFNQESFLKSLKSFFSICPDYKPTGLVERIQPKCHVLAFPLSIPKLFPSATIKSGPLHILWPHRWEHDKNPDLFFHTLISLHQSCCEFNISVLGESFTDIPDVFNSAKSILKDKILHWGYQSCKDSYFEVLQSCDVVISTAVHEFFGVAVLEAVSMGCYPLCPNRLSYPELLPKVHLYNTDNQLLKLLTKLCHNPNLVRTSQWSVDISNYLWDNLKVKYTDLLYS